MSCLTPLWGDMGRIYAIVLAAGKGSRMHSEKPKQFMEIDGHEVLWYSLKAMEESCVTDVVVVTSAEYVEYVRREYLENAGFKKIQTVVAGGYERYDSVYEGLRAICGLKQPDSGSLVLIHDGARPMVTPELIARTAEGAAKHKACIPGIPVKDTVRFIGEDGSCGATPDRSQLRAVQTPQAFDLKLCCKAYKKLHSGQLAADRITDDAMVVEAACGVKAMFVDGDYSNIKITTPEDILTAERFLGVLKTNQIMYSVSDYEDDLRTVAELKKMV